MLTFRAIDAIRRRAGSSWWPRPSRRPSCCPPGPSPRTTRAPGDRRPHARRPPTCRLTAAMITISADVTDVDGVASVFATLSSSDGFTDSVTLLPTGPTHLWRDLRDPRERLQRPGELDDRDLGGRRRGPADVGLHRWRRGRRAATVRRTADRVGPLGESDQPAERGRGGDHRGQRLGSPRHRRQRSCDHRERRHGIVRRPAADQRRPLRGHVRRPGEPVDGAGDLHGHRLGAGRHRPGDTDRRRHLCRRRPARGAGRPSHRLLAHRPVPARAGRGDGAGAPWSSATPAPPVAPST